MSTRELLVKVPAVTAFFWVIKVLATTVGETFADYLNETLGFGLTGTSIVMGAALVVALIAQFVVKRYVPGFYWTAIVLISVAGTLITDTMTDGYGIPLATSSMVFAVLLAITFIVWFVRERTLAMKSIVSAPREAFYWLAILFTFALGTAVGDLIAETIGLGYGLSLILYAVAIAVVAAAWRMKLINEIAAFWTAYILTRPLGASLGDLLAQGTADGGLGWGTTATSAVFLVAILTTVTYLAFTKKDQIRV